MCIRDRLNSSLRFLAKNLNDELSKKILSYNNEYGRKPHLLVILVGDNPASQVYVKNKEKKAAEVGIKSTVIRLSKNVSENNLLKVIDEANANISVDSILVQLPLPNHINSNKVIDRISIDKDVDGFNSKNIGLLALGRPKVIPCTPLGCYKMLESILDLEGKKVIILGRSNIVGKPLSFLLTNKNATVTLAHSKSRNLKDLCLSSDIIIAAAIIISELKHKSFKFLDFEWASVTVAFLFVNKNDKGFPTIFDLPKIITFFPSKSKMLSSIL